MSKREYDAGRHLELEAHKSGGNPFYSLLMAAMRVADSDNLDILKSHWPERYEELHARYNAPGGYLPGEEVPE